MKTIGDLIQHSREGHYHLFETAIAKVRISRLSASILRVQVNAQGLPFQENTYACPEVPETEDFDFSTSGDALIAETTQVRMVLNARPLRIRFERLDGEVITEDDPGLGIRVDGYEITNYKVLQPGERFMGLGEKTGPLNKMGMQFRNWNTDAFGYQANTDPLYATCPFFIGHSHDRPYGIFLNSTTETVFNFGAANDRCSFFQVERGELDYFFFAGPEPADILRDYTALTGRCPMPPMWSLGFQQCRYSYYPDTEMRRVAQTFRELQIPADVLYFDIHYMQDYKVFTWHEDRFPEPQKLLGELKELGFSTVTILDPGVKAEEGYEVFDDGTAKDVFLKYPDGLPYRGGAWPGWCQFPDFTESRVRAWWSAYVKRMAEMGVDGFWNDMNEFAVWGKFIPKLLRFGLEGEGGSLKDAHNVYGMQMARATHEGAMEALGDKRTFILTRATFSGGQRNSALWTGDNYASDEHMMLGARMLNGLGLSGMPFVGNDVGGFTGDASAHLYMRWMACAAFQPLMRAHTMINSKHAEPWAFGEECTEVTRNYISLRYKLLPHLYSLFYESTQNGMPPLRSLIFQFHREWKVFSKDFENQFLLGDHLLICPIESEAHFAKVYLPKGLWYDFFNDTTRKGGEEYIVEVQRDTLPIFVKAGGLIPMQNVIQHTREITDGVMRVHVYTGSEGGYQYYEDDGLSDGGHTCIRHLKLQNDGLHISAQEGKFTSKFSRIRLYLHGFLGGAVTLNGEVIEINRSDFRFMEPISNFDPYEASPDHAKVISDLPHLEVNFVPEALDFKWDKFNEILT